MFWRNNIVGFAPMLPVNVSLAGQEVTLLGTYFSKQLAFGKQDFTTGKRMTHPWWKVQGAWPDDNSSDVLLGEHLAAKLNLQAGHDIEVAGRSRRIAGILSTGGPEDDQVVAPIALAQQILGKPGAVRRIYVSAVTKPEDAFARRDPRKHVAENVRPLVLLALCGIHCIPIAGGDSPLSCRADSSGSAK